MASEADKDIIINTNIDIIQNMDLVKMICESNLVKLIKFNNKYPFTTNIKFLFPIYIALLQIIENGIEVIFSGQYKSSMVREHVNYKKGYTHCILSLKIITNIVDEVAKIYITDGIVVEKSQVILNELHEYFFHIPDDRKKHFDLIYTTLLDDNKLDKAKNINTRMYVLLLDILTPSDIYLIFTNLYEFHKILQGNRYLNKLIDKADKPNCLPYMAIGL